MPCPACISRSSVRDDGTLGENNMYFVVRDDDGRSDTLFQTSDSTWEAYNLWGGEDFYTGTPSSPTQAKKVSYNRPFGSATNSVNVPLMDAEYPMIRWMEANGYNVSYTTDVDTARRGQELLEHKAFLSVGHDEYWSNEQRANVEAARDAGVDLAFFSGNESYWKTRWENSIDGSGTPFRTLVTYKETWSNAKIDPNSQWTGTWRDPRFSPPSDGGRPENQLSGTIFQVDSYRTDAIEVPAADGKMRFWRNTSIANLAAGQTATLTPNVLGYEWDEDRDNGFRPQGAIKLSTTTLGVSQYLLDYGNTTGPGTATHNLTLYRAPSGALVFGAGTTRWSWGLDSNHINESSTVDPRMQQATVNLFADMGIQPDSLQSGLVQATASTDTAAPVSSIATPTGGTSFPVGQTVTITGTASDTGGGRVGGVEVSVDNGTSWHPASGREKLVLFVAADDARIDRHQVASDRRQPQHADSDSWRHGQRAGGDRTLESVRHHRRPDARQRERSEPGRARRQVHVGRQRVDHVAAVLQGLSGHRHPRRQHLDVDGYQARQRDFHQRNGERLAAGRLRHPGAGCRQGRPTSPPTTRRRDSIRRTSVISRLKASTWDRCTHPRVRSCQEETASMRTGRARFRPTPGTHRITGSTSSWPILDWLENWECPASVALGG